MNFDTRDHQRKVLDSIILTGNFVIAEIYRISDLAPNDFADPMSSPFGKIIADFSYFENKSLLEKFIEQNESGNRLDECFHERFSKFLNAFLNLLNAVCAFIFDFCEGESDDVRYTEKVNFSVENTLDRRFAESNALKCEALYLFGVIVLLIENEFPGVVKERIFVALYRSGVEIPSKNFELMVSMLRRRKENYVTCLSTFKINQGFVQDALAFLNSSYAQNIDSNNSEKMAAMLYVCLYFQPSILESDFTVMRQIADKFFADKWVLSLHLSLRVNAREKWAGYKAANAALAPLVDATAAARMAAGSVRQLKEIVLPSGLLSVKSLEQNARLLVDYNNCLRWIILHLDSIKAMNRSKKSSNLLHSQIPFTVDDLIGILAKLSHFEYKLRESCHFLINQKSDNSKRLKSRVLSIFDQIIYFLGSSTEESQWSEKLRVWLTSIKDCVTNLDLSDASSSQVLAHLRSKIQEVGDLYADDQIILRQYLAIIADELTQLRCICGINPMFLRCLNRQADAIYLYLFIHEQLGAFEALLKNDALAVKFIFLKLSATLANLIEPVNDDEKRQILSTFYHKKLEMQLRKIIQVIPRAIFLGMDELQGVFPTKKVIHIQKTAIKEAADLNRRQRLAKKTAEVTKLSLGISEMCIKQLGTVEIRPRELLFNGLNQELDARLRSIFRTSAPNIIGVLDAQTQKLRIFRKVFLFVCEYIGVNGTRMWQQCLTRFCDDAFDDARLHHLNAKHLLSTLSPANRMQKISQPVTNRHIVEMLVDQILSMTNPRSTSYQPLSNSWWSGAKRLSFSVDAFIVIENWIPWKALCGLRRIILRSILDLIVKFRNEFSKTCSAFSPLAHGQQLPKSVHAIVASAEFHTHYSNLTAILLRVGQLKIIEENLLYVIDEKMKTSMEDVMDSSKNLLRIFTLKRDSCEAPVKISQELYDYFINISERFLNANADAKNHHIVCALLLAIVIAFGNATSSKKSEPIDAVVLYHGLATIFTSFRIWEEFSTFGRLFLTDEKLSPTFKQIAYLYRPEKL